MSWSRPHIEYRLAAASVAMLCLTAAWVLQVMAVEAGRCLQSASPGLLHCPLCWAAGVFAAVAVLPYPRLASGAT